MAGQDFSDTDSGRLRSDKLRVTALVSRFADSHGIRILAAGGSVFVSLGLVSPRVARSAIMIVEPAKLIQLVVELESLGWSRTGSGSTVGILPPIYTRLRHPDWECVLDLYDLFPGFYASPSSVFETLWSSHCVVSIAGEPLPCLDRAATVVLAAHDRLGPLARNRRAPDNFDYFVALFETRMSPTDRTAVVELVRLVDGIEPLRPYFEAVGMDAGPIVLPSGSYARARLFLEHVSDPVLLALSLFESPPDRRWAGLRSTLRQEPGRVLRSILMGPITIVTIAGARRRRQQHLGSRPAED